VIYLDSSAVLKLVRAEDETPALRDWLVARPDEPLVTSELGRVEVLRAALRSGEHVASTARLALGDLDLVPLDRAVQDLASTIGGPVLRTLDALHLASAVLLRDHLTAFVAYDHRLADAARTEGLVVEAPGRA
jgi:uncharacterized protein